MSAAELFDRAHRTASSGKPFEAIAIFDQAVASDPALKEAWSSKAAAIIACVTYGGFPPDTRNLGRYLHEAVRSADRALDVDSKFADGWLARAEALFLRDADGDLIQALEAVDTARALDPGIQDSSAVLREEIVRRLERPSEEPPDWVEELEIWRLAQGLREESLDRRSIASTDLLDRLQSARRTQAPRTHDPKIIMRIRTSLEGRLAAAIREESDSANLSRLLSLFQVSGLVDQELGRVLVDRLVDPSFYGADGYPVDWRLLVDCICARPIPVLCLGVLGQAHRMPRSPARAVILETLLRTQAERGGSVYREALIAVKDSEFRNLIENVAKSAAQSSDCS